MKKALAIAVLCSTVAGCSNISKPVLIRGYQTGTEVTADQIAAFTEGKTTATEVRATLGAPQSEEQFAGELHFIYNYSEANNISPKKTESTRFIFGKDGKLKEVQKGKGQASNPLLGD